MMNYVHNYEKNIFVLVQLDFHFSQNQFSSKGRHCATGNHPLTESDRAEIFTTGTPNNSPEVFLAVFKSVNPIRIYMVFKVRKEDL